MKIAVITPYYKESMQVLSRCHNSVVKQTYKGGEVKHFMVADGHPQWLSFNVEHIVLPTGCKDFGDTPRGIASSIAWAQGFDAIAYLDADCWFEPNHLENMAGVMKETGRDIITCPRNLFRLDGSFMAVDKESDGYNFNDTNCYLFNRNVFNLMTVWMYKTVELCAIDDRVLWSVIQQMKVPVSRSTKPTVNYTTTLAFHYEQNNEEIPDHAKVLLDKGDGMKVYNYKETI